VLPATEFTPLQSLAGGALIGLAAVLFLAINGRIAGISGLVRRLLPPYSAPGFAESALFIVGLILTPVIWTIATGEAVHQTVASSLSLNAVAGLLVGFGTILGSGCTSGHGVCGLSRFSKRSLVATLTFMATGIAAVFLIRHVVGGWPWG
jgi:uncharacterized membrane protein YedE/YeeE